MSNAWYEVLSVLHLMASLSLSQANLLLLPRTSADGYQPKISEGGCLLKMFIVQIFFLNLCCLDLLRWTNVIIYLKAWKIKVKIYLSQQDIFIFLVLH